MDGNFDSSLPNLDDSITSRVPEPVERTGPRRVFYAVVGTALFFIFLIAKLPEARVQNLIQAHVKIAAQKQGFSFNAEKISTGIFFGPSLKFYNIELKSLENDKQVLKVPYLKIRPHVFSLLPFVSMKKVSFSSELLGGEASGTLGMAQTAAMVDIQVSNVALEKTNLIESYLPVTLGSGEISGDVDVLWNTAQPTASKGKVDLKIKKLSLPAQNVYGFALPKISVSTSTIDLSIGDGKITPRTVELGKDINTDDIVAKLTGDATIDGSKNIYMPLDRVKLNLKVAFQLSKNLMSSFQILEAILANAKTPDGKYNYRLGGSLQNPVPAPGN